ncbi:unnamed protein product [Ostreobium quekettii]|uniref:Uncharacterized protein n=1 Tax=Ostreobium quekettii TaxID=121088 RepID=A0A8S1ISH0_9CHLO|nr:unnamed protein product [Ostreobium quekettii]
MGKMEIAAGPSSQALTGNKKYSSKMGDEWEFEEQAKRGCTRYGCCGVGWPDIRLMVYAIMALYLFLGMFYWGLITAAQEVRQEEYLELAGRFFGPFSQVERPLLNISNEPIPVGQITVAEFDTFRDAKQGELSREYNRPEGCRPATSANGGEFLECDRDLKEDGRWTLFPWVSDKLATGELSVPGCGESSPDALRRHSSLEKDGTFGSQDNKNAPPAEWVLGPNTCLSYVTTSAITQ